MSAAGQFRERWPGRRTRLLAAVSLAASLLVLSPIPARWLISEAPIDGPDAIVSLGSHERERYAETARQAARWPRAQVLITVPTVVNKYNCDACDHRVGWLEELGVSRERITVLTPTVRNTRDELVTTARWLRARHASRLLIVTSPYHTRRVRVLAGALLDGLEAGVVACPVHGGLPTFWWTRHYDRFYVTYESAALLNTWWREGRSPWAVGAPAAAH